MLLLTALCRGDTLDQKRCFPSTHCTFMVRKCVLAQLRNLERDFRLAFLQENA